MHNQEKYSAFVEQNINMLSNSNFIKKCQDGTVSNNSINSFLIQHGFYSSHFIQYLCAVITNIDSHNSYEIILENLMEELGFELNNNTLVAQSKKHGDLYKNTLDDFGISNNLSQYKKNIETDILINNMFYFCKYQNSITGLGALCFGAESIAPYIYEAFVTGVKKIGLEDKDLEFFNLHIHCDDDHAEKMYKVIMNLTNGDEKLLNQAFRAGEIMTRLRVIFLDSLV